MDQTELLRRAERSLHILWSCVERACAGKDGQNALAFVNQYQGAVFMLRSLELISPEEENRQEEAILRRYREAWPPEES